MVDVQQALTRMFVRFFNSEKSGGMVLVICALITLVIANSSYSEAYLGFWKREIGGLSLEHWINDALMAVFFLFIGLELERELYSGELSNFKNALLPIFAAVGGMVVPAAIYLSLNSEAVTQAGMGIPMATDIAFALGALSLLGNRIPAALKVFVVAYAVIDDLGAIVMIALFYTTTFSATYLTAALIVLAILVALNRYRVMSLVPYLLGGSLMWFLVLKSGVHATVAGVALAFAIPYSTKDEDQESPSHRLEHFLHKPVALLILPVFALANTGITIDADWLQDALSPNSLGISLGLLLGKPVGVTLLCFIAIVCGICRLPSGLGWRHIFGAGLLGGIGFTMSIFVTNLAFSGNPEAINASKMAILSASVTAAVLGYLWLRIVTKPTMANSPQSR